MKTYMSSRRGFLRMGLGSMAAAGAMNAFAAGSDYKALVCVFLNGGNDCHNTVVPIQTAQQGYGSYYSARPGLAIPQAQLLPVSNGNDVYGLHPQLGGLQSLYTSGKLAILPNMGMLVQPIVDRQALLGGAPVPQNLYSHSDQTDQWQTAVPNNLSPTGWGGRLADYMVSSNAGAAYPSLIATGGGGIFCTGGATYPATVPPSGAIGLNMLSNNPARAVGAQQVLQFDNGLQLVQAANGVTNRGVSHAALLNNALLSGPSVPAFGAGSLAAQLRMVARIISVRSQLGISRQVFFCSLGGFDTHSAQASQHDTLMQQLGPAIAGFQLALQGLLVDQQVTLFTASEFGRTLMPNSSGGTDHAWGGHHFVAGGAVLGGKMYGSYPLLALGGPSDATGRGALIPGTSVEQVGAALAKWFGVPDPSMGSIFPNIGKFPGPGLGFMG